MTPATRLRVLIVDDEPLARQTLRLLLSAEPDVEIAGECADGLAAIDAVRRVSPDLVFLDIRMPGASGFDVLSAAGERGFAVVFVTAYDEYAVQAFAAEALDYLLKPFDDARFRETLRRVRASFALREYSVLGRQAAGVLQERPAASGFLARLLIRERGRLHVVPVSEIEWVSAAGNYVEIHTSARAHLVRQTLREFEAQLDPARFLRIHRSAIVNLDQVRELRPASHGEATAVLRSGTGGVELNVSRQRRRVLEASLLLRPAR